MGPNLTPNHAEKFILFSSLNGFPLAKWTLEHVQCPCLNTLGIEHGLILSCKLVFSMILTDEMGQINLSMV